MNPTPSQPERPEPPEGYELNDSVDHLPEGAMIRSRWYRTDNWALANLRGKDIPPEYHQNWWVSIPATRTPAPEAVAGEQSAFQQVWSETLKEATPPVEADKDAEIAAMTPGTEPHQVIARLKHEKKNLITVIDESTRNQRSLESDLTTARATIAERDQEVSQLMKDRAFYIEARDGADKHRLELLAELTTLRSKNEVLIGQDIAIRAALQAYHLALDKREHGGLAAHALTDAVEIILNAPWIRGNALTHAAEVKEQA